MTKNMYQKREERQKKALENNDTEGLKKNVINWDPRLFCKLLLYDFNILREMINNV